MDEFANIVSFHKFKDVSYVNVKSILNVRALEAPRFNGTLAYGEYWNHDWLPNICDVTKDARRPSSSNLIREQAQG